MENTTQDESSGRGQAYSSVLLLQVSLETTAAHVRHDVCPTALAGVGTCGTSLWLQGAHGYIGGKRSHILQQ